MCDLHFAIYVFCRLKYLPRESKVVIASETQKGEFSVIDVTTKNNVLLSRLLYESARKNSKISSCFVLWEP